MQVEFFTEQDSDQKSLERRLFAKARRLGIAVLPAVDVKTLARASNCNQIVIVFYQTEYGIGHFSPLLGINGRNLILPLSENGIMSVHNFQKAWCMEGIHNQAVLVRAATSTAGKAKV